MRMVKIEGIELDVAKLNNKTYELPEKVLRYFNDYLLPDENIELSLRGGWGMERRGTSIGPVATGGFSGGGKNLGGHTWFVMTNKRLIITTKGLVTTDTRDFSYDKISSVDYEKGFLTDRLTIHAMSSVEDIFFFKDVISVSRKLPAVIRSRIRRAQKAEETGAVGEDPLHALKMRLARGEISKEEFEDLKRLL